MLLPSAGKLRSLMPNSAHWLYLLFVGSLGTLLFPSLTSNVFFYKSVHMPRLRLFGSRDIPSPELDTSLYELKTLLVTYWLNESKTWLLKKHYWRSSVVSWYQACWININTSISTRLFTITGLKGNICQKFSYLEDSRSLCSILKAQSKSFSFPAVGLFSDISWWTIKHTQIMF